MKHDIYVLALIVGAFYVGKFRQWRQSREQRKINDAVRAIADTFGNPTDKKGG